MFERAFLLSFIFYTFSGAAFADEPWRQNFSTFNQSSERHSFISHDNKKIIWTSLRSNSDSKKNLVILPGRTEGSISYYEIALKMQEGGFNLAILDHRGQGLSDRFQGVDHQVSHVEYFEDYVKDVELFYQEVRLKFQGEFYLLASSMGSAVNVLSDDAQMNFKKRYYFSPMFQIKLPFSESWILRILKVLSFFGYSNSYLPLTGPFDTTGSFDENTFAHSKERFAINQKIYAENEIYKVGGPSANWLKEAILATQKVGQIDLSKKLKNAVLFLPEYDQIVDDKPSRSYCEKIKDCVIKNVNQGQHALQLETDANLREILQHITKR